MPTEAVEGGNVSIVTSGVGAALGLGVALHIAQALVELPVE